MAKKATQQFIPVEKYKGRLRKARTNFNVNTVKKPKKKGPTIKRKSSTINKK